MYIPPKKKGPRCNKPTFDGKLRLRTGDVVRVISGKDNGKEGTITRVLPSEGKVVVEGVNIMIKHRKAQPKANMSAAAQQQQAGRIPISAPMDVSKVQLIDKGTKKVTRVGVKKNADGDRVRYAKKSGGLIDE